MRLLFSYSTNQDKPREARGMNGWLRSLWRLWWHCQPGDVSRQMSRVTAQSNSWCNNHQWWMEKNKKSNGGSNSGHCADLCFRCKRHQIELWILRESAKSLGNISLNRFPLPLSEASPLYSSDNHSGDETLTWRHQFDLFQEEKSTECLPDVCTKALQRTVYEQ